MEQAEWTNTFAPDFRSEAVGRSLIVHADCFEWLQRIPEESLHAIVTDPPYGVKEYELDQIEKRTTGEGGIWRIPPAFDGNTRSPLPRFTALNNKEREVLREFFILWGRTLIPAIRPGAHVFIASNSFLSQMVFTALVEGGLEFRGGALHGILRGRCGRDPEAGGVRSSPPDSRRIRRTPALGVSAYCNLGCYGTR